MFRCVFMTCTLHVHDVFDGMFVMVRPGEVKFLFKFCMEGFVPVSFFNSKSFIKLWAVVLRLA